MAWSAATVPQVREIVLRDISACSNKQIATFLRYEVEPYFAPIRRYGNLENVVVVARKGDEVLYWEDVEEGFNISPLDADGSILGHFCNQDELCVALNAWIAG